MKETFEIIKTSDYLKGLWNKYQMTANYAKGLNYNEICSSVGIIIEILEKE
jgi:hypothetical protein